MPTPETAYKGRVSKLFDKLADDVDLRLFSTALGIGAVAGIPDKWFQVGSLIIMMELKKSSENARKLQVHRIKKLREHGIIAFCTSADPDSTGVKGQERQAIYKEMLEQLQPEQVDARLLQYACDTKKLRKHLEGLIDD